MNTDLLFGQFATLATAPDGIARLRELILRLAVQGKLGTQDPGDEPAAKLVVRIRKEKERLVKEGKIPKPQLKDNIEKRDHLPENWLYGPLGDFFYRVPVTKNKIPFTEFQKMGSIPIVDQSQNFIAGYTNQDSKLLTIPGPVIIFGDHTREIKYIDFNFVVGADGVIVLKPLNGYEKYFYLVLKSLNLEDKGYSRHYKILSNYFFPLPPLTEQHRIVSKVDRLMALCDELEARQHQERAGCLKLGTASLAGLRNTTHPEEFGRQWAQVGDAFNLILDCPENVAVLRRTILQLAVQGRLVRQEPGDEPAGLLAEKIRKEKQKLLKTGKIKPEKSLKQIELADIPYSLPTGWIWTHLNDVYDIRDGTHYTPKYHDEGVPFVTSKNIYNGHLDLDNVQYISREDHERFILRSLTEKGDILFGMIGGSIGNTVLVDVDAEFSIKNVALFKYYSLELSVPNYLYYFSVLAGNKMRQISSGGAQAFVSLKFLREYLVPLPPLAEQHRIVAKVDALMALCDALESRLKERAGVQGRLAGAVVKQVAG